MASQWDHLKSEAEKIGKTNDERSSARKVKITLKEKADHPFSIKQKKRLKKTQEEGILAPREKEEPGRAAYGGEAHRQTGEKHIEGENPFKAMKKQRSL